MKVLLLKALTCALLTTLLFINSSLAVEQPTAQSKKELIQQIVYLNKSTVDDLVTLKGIGLKKAQAILTYRDQVGAFKSIDDLIKVKGIGAKVLTDNAGRLKI